MTDSSLVHMNGEGVGCRLTAPEAIHDLGQPAEVVSLLPKIRRRHEATAAARSQAMFDIARYTFKILRINRENEDESRSMRASSMLWGVKAVVDPESFIDYLRTDVEPLDLWTDHNARGFARSIVLEDRIHKISDWPETRPFIYDFHLFVSGKPNMYGTPTA